jgi:hypothetical protein
VNETARIDFKNFIATYAGTDNELAVGAVDFGFSTPWGVAIAFDVPLSQDEIWDTRPETFSGTVASGFYALPGLAIYHARDVLDRSLRRRTRSSGEPAEVQKTRSIPVANYEPLTNLQDQ